MDEEKEGLNKKDQSSLNSVVQKLGNQTKRKMFWKRIMKMLPIILYLFVGILIIVVFLSAISNFLDLFQGEQSKKASESAVEYANVATDESSPNRIIVDLENITEDGAYQLEFEFENKERTEEEQIKQIKYDILDENDELDITEFSDSELKIIAVLMYNGLEIEDYNEEELKALTLFIKADIASQTFDLRSGDDKQINIQSLADKDEVYGTLELHKTAIEKDNNGNIAYKEIKLDYVPYGDEATRRNFQLHGST